MPLDAICLTAVAEELRRAVVGGKIDRIYQPGRDEIVLTVHGNGGNVKLLLSGSPNHPRAQLTRLSRENPAEPPMFCMLLRKHLASARILDIFQPPMERVLEFTLECLNELGDRVERKLVLEAMGRQANLILLDGDGYIVDCVRHVGLDLSDKLRGTMRHQGEELSLVTHRLLQPGMLYRLPPAQEKADPMTMEPEEVRALILSAPDREGDKLLLDAFNGVSPLVAREAAFRSGGDRGALADKFLAILDDVREKRFTPYMLVRDGKPADFSFLPVLQYGPETELRAYDSFSALLDDFYAQRESADRVKQKGADLLKAVTSARDRTARKLNNQRRELAGTQDRERLRELGDILTSNLHAMEKGMTAFQTVDFYDPEGKTVDIKLDPLLTPQQNAARYYKEYNKAKTAEKMLTIQIEKNEGELDYLNSVLESLSLAEGERDLQEIRQELTDGGYLRRAKTAAKREKRVSGRPMEFRSTAGLRISVGKNNVQNDQLTTKMAFKSDIWLHTQKIHGSHVILWTGGQAPDLESVREAAVLAAWFSQGREGKKIPVDYTPVKYVKKPAGARPGMVVYTTCETAFVDPDGELVKRLRVK